MSVSIATGVSSVDPTSFAGGAVVSGIQTSRSNVGFRILSGRMGTFDNTTPKTFRAIFELAVSGADAVAPIFANGSASTYTVAGCNARVISDLVSALPSATSVTIPSAGVIPVQPASNRRSYVVGNFVEISTVPRTDGGSGALVVFDAYISTAGTISVLGNGGSDVFTGWATRSNRKAIFRYNDGDCVTTPANFISTTNRNQSPIVGVAYRARGRVFTIMGNGDSITDGRGTIIGEGFGVPACEAAQISAGVPFEWANCGWAGITASAYKDHLTDLLNAGLKPSAVVVSNGSPNSFSTPIVSNEISSCRIAFSYINAIASASSIPVIGWTVLPTNPSQKDYNSSDALRTSYNTDFLSSSYSGIERIDFSTRLSGVTDGDGQVNMLAGSTTDNIHPNDTGNALLAPLLTNSLLKLR